MNKPVFQKSEKRRRKKKDVDDKNVKERTPVDRAFYESLVLHDRWNVGKLYANNIFDGQNFRDEIKHLAEKRANDLFGMDQEIDEMKMKIENIIMQKDNLKYLPTEKERREIRTEREKNKRVRVIPDPRHRSVLILPPIHKTIPGHQKNNTKKTTKPKRRPLHMPKNPKTKLAETPRRRRFRSEYDADEDTVSSMTSAPASVISSYPASTRTYYPSSSDTRGGESSSVMKFNRESPFKYGSLYGKTSFDIHQQRNNADDRTLNKRTSYSKEFYNEEDFKSTKARFVPKDLRTNRENRINILTL